MPNYTKPSIVVFRPKRGVIDRSKFAYFADYHARHESSNCVICEMKNAKMLTHLHRPTAFTPVVVVGLYLYEVASRLTAGRLVDLLSDRQSVV